MFGVDTLIILGIVAAATIAASHISASEQEGAANDMTKQREQFALRQQAINWHKNEQDQAAASIASRHGGHGGVSESYSLQPWADKLAIQNGADLERQAAARQADATRTNGYIQAGSTLAQGIAGQALRPASSGSNFVAGAGYAGTGADIAQRAAAYDLSPGVQTAPLRPADPSGGFQLQQSDYDLLSGGGLYSQAGGYDPARRNRYGFTL